MFLCWLFDFWLHGYFLVPRYNSWHLLDTVFLLSLILTFELISAKPFIWVILVVTPLWFFLTKCDGDFSYTYRNNGFLFCPVVLLTFHRPWIHHNHVPTRKWNFFLKKGEHKHSITERVPQQLDRTLPSFIFEIKLKTMVDGVDFKWDRATNKWVASVGRWPPAIPWLLTNRALIPRI